MIRSPAALVDCPDMLVVGADDFHMFADLPQQAAFLLRRSRQLPNSFSNRVWFSRR